MSQSPRLKLSYILPQQAQKHVSANESFRRLDALTQLSVRTASLAAEPVPPAEGDAYILPAGAAGASWSAMSAGAVAAFQDGQWLELSPRAGWRAFVEDEGAFHVHDSGGWRAELSSGGPASFAAIGVNATADAAGKLAVKSDVAIFTHDDATPGTGDARIIVNKSAAEKTASVVFQDGFSGRAEFGLTGSDDFSLKVSADGANWTNALVVDKDNGFAGFGTSAPADVVHIVPASGGGSGGLTAEKDDGFLIFSFTEYSSAAAGNAPHIMIRRARGAKAAPAALQTSDWLGVLTFRGYSPAGAFEQRAMIVAAVDAAPSGSSLPAALQFHTGTAAAAERMRIASSGYVGIGLTAPAVKLDVDGPVRVKTYAKAALPAANAGAGQMIYVSDDIGGAVIAFSDGTSWRRVTDRTVVS